jgi:hypothetical protein
MPYMTFEQLVQYRNSGRKENQKYHVKRCLKGADRSRYHYTREEACERLCTGKCISGYHRLWSAFGRCQKPLVASRPLLRDKVWPKSLGPLA